MLGSRIRSTPRGRFRSDDNRVYAFRKSIYIEYYDEYLPSIKEGWCVMVSKGQRLRKRVPCAFVLSFFYKIKVARNKALSWILSADVHIAKWNS